MRFSSQLTPLHSSRLPEVRACLDQLPRYTETRDALARLDQLHHDRARQAASNTDADLLDSVVTSLLAGDSTPKNLDQLAHAREQTERQHHAGSALLDRAEQELSARLDNTVNDNPAALFGWLTSELQSVTRDARELDLNGASDAQAAIDQDRTAQWSEFVALQSRHRHLRAAQDQCSRVVFGLSEPNRDGWELFSNVDHVWPQWYAHRVGLRNYRGNHLMPLVPPPWPDDTDQQFVWLIGDGRHAEPWAPTADQLAPVRQAATEIARQVESEYAKRPPVRRPAGSIIRHYG